MGGGWGGVSILCGAGIIGATIVGVDFASNTFIFPFLFSLSFFLSLFLSLFLFFFVLLCFIPWSYGVAFFPSICHETVQPNQKGKPWLANPRFSFSGVATPFSTLIPASTSHHMSLPPPLSLLALLCVPCIPCILMKWGFSLPRGHVGCGSFSTFSNLVTPPDGKNRRIAVGWAIEVGVCKK